jgi:hypothetical protein
MQLDVHCDGLQSSSLHFQVLRGETPRTPPCLGYAIQWTSLSLFNFFSLGETPRPPFLGYANIVQSFLMPAAARSDWPMAGHADRKRRPPRDGRGPCRMMTRMKNRSRLRNRGCAPAKTAPPARGRGRAAKTVVSRESSVPFKSSVPLIVGDGH